jgi:hypothetical protein
MLKGGHIIETTIARQDTQGYKYDGKQYVFDVQTTDGKTYTPAIDFYGELLLFHDFDNINPLEINKGAFRPAYNDPGRFAAMIANKDIRDATHPYNEEIEGLKRYITILLIIVTGIIAAITYLIIGGALGNFG